MKYFTKLAVAAAILSTSTFALAQTTTWKTIEPGCPVNQMAGMEFGLDLNGDMKVTVKTSTDGFTPEKNIDSLTLDFFNANKLTAVNFKKSDFGPTPGAYRASISGPWVFKRAIVEINADQLHSFGQIEGRVFIPDHVNVNNDLAMAEGFDLAHFNCPIVDATPRKLVDSTAITVDGKRLTLKLKDRLGVQAGPTPPTPSFDRGIEVSALWLGRGERTFFLPIPEPESEYDRFTAVGFNIDSHTMPDGITEHHISVRYEDSFGAKFVTPMQPLRMILDQVYGSAF